ncbi:hypothetical protein C1646_673933 [Rhizophagus diaphanus]|nr:hypothetical protein C1646_673933 [Rhizophagus diaphanus] [Rhizophagus sp. MUCL 43196]
MMEAEDTIMDNSITNYKEERDLKDQVASKAASSIQEFESAIKTNADNQKCIEINNKTDHNCPAYFKASDFDKRKKHRSEFIGFGKEHTAAKALEITAPFNPKNAFKQSPDKMIVKF